MDLRDIHVLICTKIGSASVGHRLVDMVGAGILGIAYTVWGRYTRYSIYSVGQVY